MTSDHSPERHVEVKPAESVQKAVQMDPMLPIDHERCRYPYCIVWVPIPWMSWMVPFLGHMGICTSTGVIHDFAGPFFVSEDKMAFGRPTKYWQLTPEKAHNGQEGWDHAVAVASEIYKKKMHVLCYDNCHCHVATALNIMNYDGRHNWTMFQLAVYMLLFSKTVSFSGFLRTWMPLPIIIAITCLTVTFARYLVMTFSSTPSLLLK